MEIPTALIAVAAAVALVAAGCGGSKGGSSAKPVNPQGAEVSPPGDIPDNQAFVRYAPPGQGYSVKVPEGWARTASGGAVTFSDKLNSVRMQTEPAGGRLSHTAGKVTTVQRGGRTATRIVYVAAGKPDAVTGKARSLAVERYVFRHGRRDVVLTLSGARGADNVDPWKIVSDSVRITR
jgi:hypothetical protein